MAGLIGRASLKTAPDTEPVTVAQAKVYCRVDSSDEDTPFDRWIEAARQQVEAYTGRALVSQTWELWIDADDLGSGRYANLAKVRADWPLGASYPGAEDYIKLPHPPLLYSDASDLSIVSYDTDNDATTFSADYYQVDAPDGPRAPYGRVYLNIGRAWPSSLRSRNSLKITYTAGYGTSAGDVPDAITEALLRMIGTMYEQRSDEVVGTSTARVTYDARRLLSPYRVIRI